MPNAVIVKGIPQAQLPGQPSSKLGLSALLSLCAAELTQATQIQNTSLQVTNTDLSRCAAAEVAANSEAAKLNLTQMPTKVEQTVHEPWKMSDFAHFFTGWAHGSKQYKYVKHHTHIGNEKYSDYTLKICTKTHGRALFQTENFKTMTAPTAKYIQSKIFQNNQVNNERTNVTNGLILLNQQQQQKASQANVQTDSAQQTMQIFGALTQLMSQVTHEIIGH